MHKKRQITEAIILAGGKGTRLRSAIGDYPKPLAPINGAPFLAYLLHYLKQQGITRIILSVGYQWEQIKKEFGEQFKGIDLIYVVESKPLGTGGGIRLALNKIENENAYILNGDTLFNIGLSDFEDFHLSSNATCSIALKTMHNVDRYGTIVLDKNDRITAFEEKTWNKTAAINGGVYCIKKNALDHFKLNEPFSFEIDYLTTEVKTTYFAGQHFNAYFKDIGIPEDYKQFEEDITNNTLKIIL